MWGSLDAAYKFHEKYKNSQTTIRLKEVVYGTLATTNKLTYDLKSKLKENQFSISSPLAGTHFPTASQWAVIEN